MSECPSCHGSGFVNVKTEKTGFDRQTCPHCQGRGVLSRLKKAVDYQVLVKRTFRKPEKYGYERVTCPHCHGKGTVLKRIEGLGGFGGNGVGKVLERDYST